MQSVLDAAKACGSEIGDYWRVYGGLPAFRSSPILWLSLALTIFCFPLWTSDKWQDTAISIMPNLLGFSLGAMAIVLAFPSTQMFRLIAEGGRSDSYYIELASKFVHFIFAQVSSIIFAIAAKSYSCFLLSFIGFWLLIYALLAAAMTALALYGVAKLYNHAASPVLSEEPLPASPAQPESSS